MFQQLLEFFRFLTDVQRVISWGGTALVSAIVFVETGLFFGFFLPGDSLLVSAGIFAAAGRLNLTALLVVASICAVAGDQVGYYLGRKAGQALYWRPDSLLFKRRHLARAHEFYEKYGPKTIVLARFVPIVRTFAPAVAGAAEMNYRKFVIFNMAGGILWVFSMVLLGYSLGSAVPDIERHIELVIALVVFLSFLPGLLEFWRARSRSKA